MLPAPVTAIACRRARVLALSALLLLVGGCAGPRPAVQRAPSQALTGTDNTRLGQALAPLLARHPGVSGFHVFDEPQEAFAARVLQAMPWPRKATPAQLAVLPAGLPRRLRTDNAWVASAS